MKLTWFAKSCFRLHVGGRIIVTDPHEAPPDIAQHELLSGADDVIDLCVNDLAAFDASNWARRPRLRLIDAPEEIASSVSAFAKGGLFVGSEDDAPLFLAPTGTEWGRFADESVVVLHGAFATMPDELTALCTLARPRLVALAADVFDAELIDAIAAAAQGAPLQIMEQGLALET